MFMNIADALGRFFANKNEGDAALVRLFRTEYPNEYHFAKKNGVPINDRFVRDFLADR